MRKKLIVLSASTLIISLFSLLSACSNGGKYSAQGIVQAIENGKDGYTAVLKGDDGKDFDAVISRVKMEKEYKILKVGDTVELFGDTIHLDNKVRILVHQIKAY
ncbi:MAG: hypothetical protein V4714_20670 [Bacteroidota bacterium]